MRQGHDIGETKFRPVLAKDAGNGIQRRQFRVGGREDNHIGWRLAQIDGLLALVDASASAGKNMHVVSRSAGA